MESPSQDLAAASTTQYAVSLQLIQTCVACAYWEPYQPLHRSLLRKENCKTNGQSQPANADSHNMSWKWAHARHEVKKWLSALFASFHEPQHTPHNAKRHKGHKDTTRGDRFSVLLVHINSDIRSAARSCHEMDHTRTSVKTYKDVSCWRCQCQREDKHNRTHKQQEESLHEHVIIFTRNRIYLCDKTPRLFTPSRNRISG